MHAIHEITRKETKKPQQNRPHFVWPRAGSISFVDRNDFFSGLLEQFLDVLSGPAEHRPIATFDDWALNQIRMLCH